MRVTVLNVSVVTPSSAARSGSGRMTISGFIKLALDVTLLSPGTVRRSRSTAEAARFSDPDRRSRA